MPSPPALPPADLDDLRRAVLDLHGVKSTFAETVHVREVFRGEVAWEGDVCAFDLQGHPLASRAYVWSFVADSGRRRFVAVLQAGPIVSAHTAMQAWAVNEGRKLKAAGTSGSGLPDA